MKSNDKIIEEKISKNWEENLKHNLETMYDDNFTKEEHIAEFTAFILKLLEQKEREMVEILESLKTKEYCCTSSECGDQAGYDGRNNALDEAISKLKQPKE